MWPATALTKLFDIHLPIVLAPMAGAGTPALAAAVSNAGGLGSLGAGYMPAEAIRQIIREIRQLTDKPFAINLFVPEAHFATEIEINLASAAIQEACHELKFTIEKTTPPYAPSFEEQMQVLIDERVPVFSFTFGIPNKAWIKRFKKNGIRLIGTATNLEEARQLESAEVDAVSVQGGESGGHRGTFIGSAENSLMPTLQLISQLKEHIHIPLIAAGGIMNATGIIDAITAGATAVQMGTAFLCMNESGIHPLYKKLLLALNQDQTVLTRTFSGKLVRGIQNKFIERMEKHKETILPYPIQNSLTTAMRKEAQRQNNIDFMSMWAGQSAYLCKAMTVAEFINELNDEVSKISKPSHF